MAEGLYAARKFLNEILNIYELSFGPWGKDVLLRSDTGLIYVTKNGLATLRQLEIAHPIGLLIKKSVEAFADTHGDFSKTFIIILSSIIDLVYIKYFDNQTFSNVQYRTSTLRSIINGLQKIQSIIQSPELFDHIKARLNAAQIGNITLTSEVLSNVFVTNLTNQYSKNLEKHLQSIVHDIQKIIALTRQNVSYIVNNFDKLCTNVCGLPLYHSKIVQGVIIKREANMRNIEKDDCCFIVMTGSLSRNSSDVHLDVSNEYFSQQESAMTNFYSKLIEALNQHKIEVLLTEEPFPNQLAFELCKNHIVHVSYLEEDDISKICEMYSITPISGLYDMLSISSNASVVGKATFFRSCILGQTFSSHLGPRIVRDRSETFDLSKNLNSSGFVNFQILLCSVTDGLAAQYKTTLHSFFKVLRCCLLDNSNEYVFGKGFQTTLADSHSTQTSHTSKVMVTPASGAFEIMIHEFFISNKQMISTNGNDEDISHIFLKSILQIPITLFKNSSKSKNHRLIIPGMKESLMKCNFNKTGRRRINNGEMNIISGSGICKNVLNNVISDTETDVTDIFSNQIPQKLVAKMRHSQQQVPHTILGVNGMTGELLDLSKSNLLEPLSSKLTLLTNMLDVCIQITRVDNIVPIRKCLLSMDKQENVDTDSDY